MKISNTADRLKLWLEVHNAKQVDILSRAEPYMIQYGIRLNKSDISQYISGKVEPGQKKLFILAKALGVSEAWLMGYKDNSLTYEDRETIKNNARDNLIDLELTPEQVEDAYLTIFTSYYYRSIGYSQNNKINNHPKLDSYVAMLLNQRHWRDQIPHNIYNRLVSTFGVETGMSEGSTIFLGSIHNSKKGKSAANSTNGVEQELIKKYAQLDDFGKRAVAAVTDIEYERCRTPRAARAVTASGSTRVIPYSNLAASAGLGEWLDSESMDEIEIPDTPANRSVDFAVPVSGDSMMPTYRDGDILLIHEQDAVNVGDIGLFAINGNGYVKEMGDCELISHNHKYDNIQINDSFKCFGKVIGKL